MEKNNSLNMMKEIHPDVEIQELKQEGVLQFYLELIYSKTPIVTDLQGDS